MPDSDWLAKVAAERPGEANEVLSAAVASARARDLRALISAIYADGCDDIEGNCFFCGATGEHKGHAHASDCLWLRIEAEITSLPEEIRRSFIELRSKAFAGDIASEAAMVAVIRRARALGLRIAEIEAHVKEMLLLAQDGYAELRTAVYAHAGYSRGCARCDASAPCGEPLEHKPDCPSFTP